MDKCKIYYSLQDYISKFNLSTKIVIQDIEAYIEYKNYNIIYDKFWLSKSQNMICGPMGVYPKKFPIIFKPVINLYGMSRGFKKINSFDEYDKSIKDGFFWQPFFEGKQICLDLILNDTKILFKNALCSVKDNDGSFDYHYNVKNYNIPQSVLNWINKYLINYKGCLNLEIINNNIIEAHLRLNGDFHYYNYDFCKQLHNLFESNFNEHFNFTYEIPNLYLFPIFLERSDISKFDFKKQLKLENILKKSDIVNTFYFNEIDTLSQGTLLRVIYFDSFSFELGKKLKKFIINLILK